MATESGVITRRAAILTALGAAGGAAIALAAPPEARAADGEPVTLGQTGTATATTTIETTGAHALVARTDLGDAVRGFSTAEHGIGVLGVAESALGNGVGAATMVANGNALLAVNYGNQGLGALETPTAGVLARQNEADWALRVDGRVTLDRSGRATIEAGRRFVVVSVPGGLAGTPLAFANLMSYRSGTYVASVRVNEPSAGKLRIDLNRSVTKPTRVAWLVLR
jgi:hypothetical protein